MASRNGARAQVIVWDTNQSEPIVGRSRIDDYFHREAIASLAWVYDAVEKEHLVRAAPAGAARDSVRAGCPGTGGER